MIYWQPCGTRFSVTLAMVAGDYAESTATLSLGRHDDDHDGLLVLGEAMYVACEASKREELAAYSVAARAADSTPSSMTRAPALSAISAGGVVHIAADSRAPGNSLRPNAAPVKHMRFAVLGAQKPFQSKSPSGAMVRRLVAGLAAAAKNVQCSIQPRVKSLSRRRSVSCS